MTAPWTLPAADRAPEAPSLRRYLETIRERWWLVCLAVLVCLGAATLYVVTAPRVYEAHADMLVTPIPDDGSTPPGLGLIRRAADPTRDVTTASLLIDNEEVAARVARTLGLSASPQALLAKVTVEPVAQTSIVSITARDNSPRMAQELANAFGAAAVAQRTDQLHAQVDAAIQRLQARIKALAPPSSSGATDPAAQPLYDELATLESLSTGPDPTLRLETAAAAPRSPVAPRTTLSLVAGLLAGLVIGIGGAFAVNVLDPRRPLEDRLAGLGLPILARVPRARASRQSRHAFEESFRFLRAAVRFARPDEPSSTIAVTSVSEGEGKTTTAYQLAMAALEAGQTVLLVEADVYRPSLRRMPSLQFDGHSPTPGMLDYLGGRASLEDVVHQTPLPGLLFVGAGQPSTDSITGLLETERGRSFVSDLVGFADLVVLDCPPVGPRSDAVLLAAAADGVLFVVDLRHTSEEALSAAIRRLRGATADVLGAVVNRDASPAAAYDYRPVPDDWSGRPGRSRPRLLRR